MKFAAYSLAAIASMVLGTSVDAHSTFDICQGGKNLLGIHHVDTVFKDGAIQVTARGTALDSIMGEGSAKLVVKAVGIPLMMETISISDEARRNHNLRAGETFEETIVQAIPFEFPRGLPLDAELVFYDTQNEEASCVEFDFTLENEETLSKSGMVTTSPFDYAEYLFKQWFNHFEQEIPIAITDMEDAFSTFKKNLMKIIFHNEGDHTYTMSMNQFGAMTPQQFTDTLMGYRKPDTDEPAVKKEMHVVDSSVTLPAEVDWTTKGAVTNVKNQGACGSCWSFATTGALEGAYYLKYGKLVSFSEEQLVTCDHTDLGCGGGIMDYAYQWIEKNGGICEESADPYVSGNGRTPSCDKSCKVVPNSAPKSFVDVPHSEEALKSAVAQQPVAIAIEADQLTFQFYSRGVMTGKCGTQLDHGVLVVGYGTEKGVDYWKVKNSWGPAWGDHGYIRFQRGKKQRGGECGILNSASYPSF